jgi:hypothetical protein
MISSANLSRSSNQKHIGRLSNIGKTSASTHETGANHYPILRLPSRETVRVVWEVKLEETRWMSYRRPRRTSVSGFDFYHRKLFSPSTSLPRSPFASPLPSRSQLTNTSLADVHQKEPPNPAHGYHSLISMFYLAREKMERDRAYGTGHFTSSLPFVNPLQPRASTVRTSRSSARVDT